MSPLEVILTLIPPAAVLLFSIITARPFDKLIEGQSDTIGKEAHMDSGQTKIMCQVAKSAAGVTALFPAMLGLIVSVGVVIYCYGLLFLIVSIIIVMCMSFITIVIAMSDFRTLHRNMERVFETDAEAYTFTPLQMINRVVIGVNGLLIVMVLGCYIFLPGSCSAEGHAPPDWLPGKIVPIKDIPGFASGVAL
jgi:hypothetical protein